MKYLIPTIQTTLGEKSYYVSFILNLFHFILYLSFIPFYLSLDPIRAGTSEMKAFKKMMWTGVIGALM